VSSEWTTLLRHAIRALGARRADLTTLLDRG
jgi:hypothetical protein